MAITSATATQITTDAFLVEWVADTDPAVRWELRRILPEPTNLTYYYEPAGRRFVFIFPAGFAVSDGDTCTFRIVDGGDSIEASTTYEAGDGLVDPYQTAPRYTTVATVKARLRIPENNTTFDDRITTAIVSGEYAIDAEIGRSFPEPDKGALIPVALTEAATNVAVRIYKSGDAPAGVAGSDDVFGALDLTEQVRSEISRQPILLGFKTSWGVA